MKHQQSLSVFRVRRFGGCRFGRRLGCSLGFWLLTGHRHGLQGAEDCVNGFELGGFAHGDYLRTGAIARFSPVMGAVQSFASAGGPLIGICNGFQVLLEAGLLPGAMLRNTDMYRCQFVHVRVEQTDTPFTNLCAPGQVLKIPIAHGEGNYFADPEALEELERNRQVIFRYVSPAGEVTKEGNPNGSLRNIAGICNRARNVVGLMQHPERACESPLGSADGKIVLDSVVHSLIARV